MRKSELAYEDSLFYFTTMFTAHFTFLFILCLYCHVLDDYFFQGCLANLKQKQWWVEQTKNLNDEAKEMYKYDYIVALICHSVSWSVSIMAPLIWSEHLIGGNVFSYKFYCIAFLCNTFVHAITDNAKANEKCINLVWDQCIHFLQIGSTVFFWFLIKAIE